MNDAMPQGNGTKTVEYRPYRQIVGETDIVRHEKVSNLLKNILTTT